MNPRMMITAIAAGTLPGTQQMKLSQYGQPLSGLKGMNSGKINSSIELFFNNMVRFRAGIVMHTIEPMINPTTANSEIEILNNGFGVLDFMKPSNVSLNARDKFISQRIKQSLFMSGVWIHPGPSFLISSTYVVCFHQSEEINFRVFSCLSW